MRASGLWKVAHLSDFHVGLLSNHWRDWLSKGLIAQTSYLMGLQRKVDLALLTSLPTALSELGVDAVLLSGDFTTAGSEREFALARTFIESLRREQLLCFSVPGNHDHYSRRERVGGYYGAIYPTMDLAADFNLFEKRFERHSLRNSDNSWDIWLLDQTAPTSWISSSGRFEEKATDQLVAAQREVSNSANNSLVCGHFPLHNTRYGHRRLNGRSALSQAIGARHQNRLYAHGHTHQFHIVDERPGRGFVSVDAGSCTDRALAGFNVYELGPTSATIRRYQLARDPNGNAPAWHPGRAFTWSWTFP